MIRLVILDLDETVLELLVDWEKVQQEVLAFGRSRSITVSPNPGMHIIEISSAISKTKELKGQVDSIWRKHELASIDEKGINRYPLAEQFARDMKRKGALLAIASNNCHQTAERALEAAEIRGLFDLIVCRDDVKNPKPHPQMLLKILKELKIPKSEAVFIGNSERNDLPAGNSAGIKTIIIQPGSSFPKIQ